MKNLLLATLLTTLFFTSCSNDDNTITEEPIAECKVLGTNGTNEIGLVDHYPFLETISDSETTTDIETITNTSDDILYLVQYEYDAENKLISRIRYESANDIEADLKETDNITYDSSNRIAEISTYNRVSNYTAVKVFEYNNSDTLPSKLTRYRIDESNTSPLLSYTDTFSYNNNNQLIKVIKNYREGTEQNPIETIYEYNTDGNLTKIEAVASGENEFDNWTSTETFENYDTQRNPLKGLPFSDVRGRAESNNNYFKYSYSRTFNNTQQDDTTLTSSPIEINSYSFEPTDSYYPLLASYQCDE